MAALSMDTAVKRLEGTPGAYAANLPDAWNYLMPSGGVLMTVALRAMQAELDDAALKPLSATAVFCTPVPAGELSIGVHVLRRGKVAAQVRAAVSLATAEELGLEVTATFGRGRHGFDVVDSQRPDVPPPDQCRPSDPPDVEGGRSQFLFQRNLDVRIARGNSWWEEGWSPSDARLVRWMRYLDPPRLWDGALDPLAIPPIADTMPPALRQKLGPEAPPFYAPSLDLTVHFLEPIRTDWLLVHTHVRHARGGYASGEAEIWSEDGRLVAYATQAMILRRLKR